MSLRHVVSILHHLGVVNNPKVPSIERKIPGKRGARLHDEENVVAYAIMYRSTLITSRQFKRRVTHVRVTTLVLVWPAGPKEGVEVSRP